MDRGGVAVLQVHGTLRRDGHDGAALRLDGNGLGAHSLHPHPVAVEQAELLVALGDLEQIAGRDLDVVLLVQRGREVLGGLDRDVVEDLWRKRRRKGQKKGDKIGYAVKRVQYRPGADLSGKVKFFSEPDFVTLT